jgi:hypothetical protein
VSTWTESIVLEWLAALADAEERAASLAAKHGAYGVVRVDGETETVIGVHTAAPAGRRLRASEAPASGAWLPKTVRTFRKPWLIR